MSSRQNVVVVGAGVVGLTTALALARRHAYNVTLVAKHMPGDHDIEYTSPWAGANWMASAGRSTREQQWEQTSFYELWSLANSVPAAGIHVQDIVLYTREKDMDKPSDIPGAQRSLLSDNPWFENFIQGFRKLEAHELPKGVASGTTFKSVCINTAVYLPWLVSMLLAEGVTIKRAVLTHICEAKDLHCGIAGDKAPVVVVVNCTGINARKLGGVMDETVVPVRGQTVVVRNTAPSMFTISGSDGGPDECTYIMTRAAGGGTVLGGTYQLNNWESQPDPNTAQRIMKRAIDICPELVKPGQGVEGLSVIRHAVGLRPLRYGGVRLESEVIDGVNVVHNYGACGFGYQASYGMAESAAILVDEIIGGIKAKL